MSVFEQFRQQFSNGDTIFLEGSMGDCAYLIESGSVEITIQQRGKPIVLATRSKGEIFGEMAIVDNQPRSASARAIGNVELLIVSQDLFKYRLELIDPVLQLVLRTILERFRETLMRLKCEISDFGVSVPATSVAVGGSADWGRKDALDKIKLEHDLSRGLLSDELFLQYQPIVDVASSEVIAFESLVRWNHPDRGMMPPAMFIGAAEDGHLVARLGRHVINEACRALKLLTETERCNVSRDLMMHVNVSPRHLLESGFVDDVVQITETSGVEPPQLVLEVTESVLIDRPDEAMATLSRCSDQGYSIALDDFGTGYSSLSYLSQFPLSEIKIDRSFVASMFTNQRSMNILKMLCNLSQTLNLRLVAEGIEEQREADAVRVLGCDFGQGYLFGRPMNLGDAQSYLAGQHAT